MRNKVIHTGDYVETTFGNGYVLKVDKIHKKVIIPSTGTALEQFFDTITISYDLIKKVRSKYFYKIRYQNDLQGDDVVDLDFDSMQYAKKRYNQICSDSTKYNVVLMKYMRTATHIEWVEDLCEGDNWSDVL